MGSRVTFRGKGVREANMWKKREIEKERERVREREREREKEREGGR